MSSVAIGFSCIGLMLFLMVIRIPIALTMAVSGFVGFALIVAFDPALAIVENGPFEVLTNYNFSPIPMFILMGVLASKSKMSSQLFNGARALFGSWPAGISLASLMSCGIFSAISGSSVATAASMSRVALPEMRKYGYAPSLATGTLAAGGTLGLIIPPSIALLIYALITEQSVGDMFMAGILPGYALTVVIQVKINPKLAAPGEATTLKQKLHGLIGLLPFTGVFVVIIGGMYTGIFTPTEAAAIGAFCTLLIAIKRGMRLQGFIDALKETLITSCLIFFMIMGAEIFGFFLSVSRISFELVDFVGSLNLSPFMVLLSILLLFVILGCVMDSIAMLLLTVPVVFPLVQAAGIDPVWFGILAVICVELGMITPPLGMNVFVIKAFAQDVSVGTIYKGVMPFVISDFVRIGLVIAFPVLALGLT